MSTLAHKIDTMQAAMEGEHKVNKDSLSVYVRQLIHDNACYRDGTFNLNVSDLSHEDKTIFLSRLVSAEDYEYYMQSQFLLRVAIRDNEWWMQTLINSHIPQAWSQIQDEIDEWKTSHDKTSRREWLPCGIGCDHDDWFTQTYAGC